MSDTADDLGGAPRLPLLDPSVDALAEVPGDHRFVEPRPLVPRVAMRDR